MGMRCSAPHGPPTPLAGLDPLSFPSNGRPFFTFPAMVGRETFCHDALSVHTFIYSHISQIILKLHTNGNSTRLVLWRRLKLVLSLLRPVPDPSQPHPSHPSQWSNPSHPSPSPSHPCLLVRVPGPRVRLPLRPPAPRREAGPRRAACAGVGGVPALRADGAGPVPDRDLLPRGVNRIEEEEEEEERERERERARESEREIERERVRE
jgi:hypothetical protein